MLSSDKKKNRLIKRYDSLLKHSFLAIMIIVVIGFFIFFFFDQPTNTVHKKIKKMKKPKTNWFIYKHFHFKQQIVYIQNKSIYLTCLQQFFFNKLLVLAIKLLFSNNFYWWRVFTITPSIRQTHIGWYNINDSNIRKQTQSKRLIVEPINTNKSTSINPTESCKTIGHFMITTLLEKLIFHVEMIYQTVKYLILRWEWRWVALE